MPIELPPPAADPPTADDICRTLEQAAAENGIPVEFFARVIWQSPERPVLMEYVDDEATQKRFYEALLKLPWLAPKVRNAIMWELKQFPAYLNRWDSQQARNEGVFWH